MLNSIRDMGQSLFVKFLFGAIILTFIFWGVSSASLKPKNDIASVNGETISLRSFQEGLEAAKRGNPQIAEAVRNNPSFQSQFKSQILQRLISNILLRQEANRLGIIVTPQELYLQITSLDAFKGVDGAFDKKKYQQVVSSWGMSLGEFEARQLEDLLRSKLYKYMVSTVEVSQEEAHAYFNFYREERKADYLIFPLADYTKKITVSDQEIADYYEKNKETYREPARVSLEHIILTPETLSASYPVTDEEISSVYEAEKSQKYAESAQVKERHIILMASQDSSERAQIKARIESVRKEIADGADFAQKAAEVSDDRDANNENTAEWISLDQLTPLLTSSLENVKAGELSDVVELPNGFVFFKVEERKEKKIKPLSEVKEAIRNELSSQKVLADEKNIEAKAENYLREGKSIGDIAKEFKAPLVKTGLIPLEKVTASLGLLQSADDTLRVVNSGKMVPMTLPVKNGIAVVYVAENIPAGIPSLDSLKVTVKKSLVESKASALAKEDAQNTLAYVKTNNGKLPKNLEGSLKRTERALRASPNNHLLIEPLGEAPALVHDLFINEKGVWLSNVYDVKGGVAIAKVGTITTGTDEEWNMYQKSYADGLLIRRTQDAEAAFIQSLLLRGKITENSDLIQQVPLF